MLNITESIARLSMLTLDLSGFDAMIAFEQSALNAPVINLPLYTSKVSAGFPSPTEEHVEKRLNPNDYLIDQQDATFFVSIQGYSMIDVGLLPKDKAVVDRSRKPSMGNIVDFPRFSRQLIMSEITKRKLNERHQIYGRI